MTSRLRLSLPFFVALLLVAAAPLEAKKKAHKKSPHAEIVATATVTSPPARTVHKNRREFLEFDVKIASFKKAPEGDTGGDPDLEIATDRSVHVVHDFTCGGAAIELREGDTVELKGEYVHPPRGQDILHFTHPADGSCGPAGEHPGGYLRKR